MEGHRPERVSEALREELAELIGYEMSDPRVASVDVTEVVVAPDMRHARVRISCAGDERSRLEALRALDGARHFLRRELSSRLRLFRIPELNFEADTEAGERGRVEQLLQRIRKARPRPEDAASAASAPARCETEEEPPHSSNDPAK
jgi:ribosome-binding factor A